MTLQNLSKILDKYESQLGSPNTEQFDRLKGLPFYNFQNPKDSNTFNHRIGLPQKNGHSYPLFDYEQMLFDTLQQQKHVWIKKATGLGITEFMLRYMAWLCFHGSALKKRITSDFALSTSANGSVGNQLIGQGSQMCIVTGPRIELAITLIDRMKGLFREINFTNSSDFSRINSAKPILFDSKETVIELSGVHIEAYPSHHLDDLRGLKDVSFIYLDEADFFPPGQQQDARDVSERYIAKSNPWIVMSSTPNAPDQLFDHIEQEPKDTCLYKRILLDYTYGLDRIYTREEIDAAKASPSFEREYNLKYLGLIGNVFHTKDIEAAIEKANSASQLLNSITLIVTHRSRWV